MKRTVDKEQFFTSATVVKDCLSLLRQHCDLNTFDLVLEPSAGAGAFLHQLPAGWRLGLDIDPRAEDVLKQDFLCWLPDARESKVLTVGNPPYGQRAALAFDFINHACLFSDVVAFILPRSFNKWTFQNRMPSLFHLVASMNCQDFESVDGTAVAVNSVFQIWVKRKQARELIDLPSVHPDFEMRHAHLSRVGPDEIAELHQYDLAIAQVGSNFRPRPANLVTKGSYWFIKLKAPALRVYFDQLDFSFNLDMNTAHSSLSKRDIIYAYMQVPKKGSASTADLDSP